MRLRTADVKLAFHFIYTRDFVTQELIFHCIFFLSLSVRNQAMTREFMSQPRENILNLNPRVVRDSVSLTPQRLSL